MAFLIFAFAKMGNAQTSAFTTDDVSGVYKKGGKTINVNIVPKTSVITWSLTLSPNGRFEYHNFRQLKGQKEEHWWARGNWKLKGKIVLFTTTEDDINHQFTIDLNNTKARFFKKSPRSKSPKIQPTYIQFFESDYSLTKNLKLPKTDE
ncbi:hypothetical protein DCS32_10070 [Dokdonia sp. Dokd-P16]|nr:hypothetical protein DCS32_10070 [Dokdonia sp. Dokd-P16]